MEGEPEWLAQYRNEMQLRDDDDAAPVPEVEPGWGSDEDDERDDTPTNDRNGAQRNQQRNRHVIQRRDEDADIDQPLGLDELEDLLQARVALRRRREGRRRARRQGRRRRRRLGLAGETVI